MQGKYEGLLKFSFAAAGALLFAGCIASSDPQDGSAAAAREASSAEDEAAKGGVAKIMVCHIPPGNPANHHTIIVGLPAVDAHLAHGDKLGFCANGESDDDGSVDGGGTVDGDGPVDGDGTVDGGGDVTPPPVSTEN
jgi:hypothetical protein